MRQVGRLFVLVSITSLMLWIFAEIHTVMFLKKTVDEEEDGACLY